MSANVFAVDLRSFKRLRMACQQCGFVLEIPSGTPTSLEYPFPNSCPSRKMPVHNGEKFRKGLGSFFATIFHEDNLKGFDIFLESDKGYPLVR